MFCEKILWLAASECHQRIDNGGVQSGDGGGGEGGKKDLLSEIARLTVCMRVSVSEYKYLHRRRLRHSLSSQTFRSLKISANTFSIFTVIINVVSNDELDKF